MKIGIVNDLPMAAEGLRRVLALAPEHQVIWIAKDGQEAVDLCAKRMPDLVLMDLVMPVMDGVEATRRIMASTPCAIMIVTAGMESKASRVFEAMGYGALDAVDTPALGSGDMLAGAAPLLAKIGAIGRLLGEESRRPSALKPSQAPPASQQTLVAVGASAGGPAALAEVLRALPRSFPAAIIIVQHVDERFVAGMAEWLGQQSTLPVRLAREGDRPLTGTALVAGTGDHLVLTAGNRLGYTPEPQEYVYRPSVDVFFNSVIRFWPGKAIGVLLTGMGSDGASGLKALRDKGFYTITQDAATSAVYGMPKAAAAMKAAVDILPLNRIGPRLLDVLAARTERGIIA
jgi:chemotaxis response regulator CheB